MAQITIDLAKDILNGAGVTKNEIDQLCNLFLASTPRIVQLEIELAEAKKDQARYQWLRNKANSTKEAAPLVFFTDDTCKPTWQNVLHSADLDCAIDAAIKDQQ